jgi:two-component system, chemotaxis family, chemotaxis protein CheY
MKVLIVEDDFSSRRLLQSILAQYGSCDIAVNGAEAIQAFEEAIKESDSYDLIFMDIMMPQVDGHEALAKIRKLEEQYKVPPTKEAKVIMTSALSDPKNVFQSLYKEGAYAYLVKPLGKQNVIDEIKKLGLI